MHNSRRLSMVGALITLLCTTVTMLPAAQAQQTHLELSPNYGFGGAHLTPRDALFNVALNYPFREDYSLAGNNPWGRRAHSLLTVPQTQVRNGRDFSVNIRLYNDQGLSDFYNVSWDRLISLPGRLALYDADKHYVCNLLERNSGSFRSIKDRDWTPIQPLGYAEATLSVSLPYPSYIRILPGIYYLQVIYLTAAVEPLLSQQGSILHTVVSANEEVFRSNAVGITVVK